MSNFCLDTNIILLITSEYKEGTEKFIKSEKIKKYLSNVNIDKLCITEITKLEILSAQYKYENKKGENIPYSELNTYQKSMLNIFKKRNKILANLKIYSLNSQSMTVYKDTNFVNKSGQKDHCDFFIASICISNDLALITDDKDFGKIDGLKIEDWTTKTEASSLKNNQS